MSNKRMRPIKMIGIFTARSTVCMANISSLTYFEIAMCSCTRVAILDIVTFEVALLTSTSKRVLPNMTANFPVFCQWCLPIILLIHTSMNYITELFSRIAKFITCWPCARALECADSGRGSNIHSLLSAHHLIGTYFLTTKHALVNQTLRYIIDLDISMLWNFYMINFCVEKVL